MLKEHLSVGLLNLEFEVHPILWVSMPILAFVALFLSGMELKKKLTQQSPMLLLKENQS